MTLTPKSKTNSNNQCAKNQNQSNLLSSQTPTPHQRLTQTSTNTKLQLEAQARGGNLIYLANYRTFLYISRDIIIDLIVYVDLYGPIKYHKETEIEQKQNETELKTRWPKPGILGQSHFEIFEIWAILLPSFLIIIIATPYHLCTSPDSFLYTLQAVCSEITSR